MIGPKLGSYELREEIGRGGMAVIYRAYQPNVDRDVAIKVISKDLGRDAEAIERFQREARLIARLEHPHILPVYDFDGGHEPPYIVMRYLVGGSLHEFIQKGTLKAGNVADIFSQVCSSMDYAHRQGIVHRDIKPSNILIDLEGNAFVSDFGIARMIAGGNGGDGITGGGAFVGTPEYMSPEQITAGQVDHRADIYALGILLFQMTTGRLPFKADNPAAILSSHLHEPVPSALQYNPDLPAQVDDVIIKAMAKDRDDRYTSAAELAEAVSDVIGDSRLRVSGFNQKVSSGKVTQKNFRNGYSHLKPPWTPVDQKRNVTALYADAADYVAALGKLYGSETAKQHLERFWRKVEEQIVDLGGAKIVRTGDSLLALWGIEVTREDDAERAVKAALSILESHKGWYPAGALPKGSDGEIPIGIGLNSGMALVTPDDKRGEFVASGATQSIANRLAQEADSDILISQSTYSQVRGVFIVSQHSQLKMRYLPQPVQTYKVLSAKPTAFRILTRGIEGVETRMVGREAELQILRNAFLDAIEDNETQVITIVSEAGLGKSRLLYEFSIWAELRSEVYWFFRSRPTPEMVNRPYGLLRDLLTFRFGILDSDNQEEVRNKLKNGIEQQIGVNDEIAPVLGQLAGFDYSENRLVKGLMHDPQQLAERAKKLFNDWIKQLCGKNPVVIELDDIHYADDASLDMINDLIGQNDELPLLVIGLARGSLFDRRPNWGRGLSNHTRMELRPLDKRVSRGLVREILQKVESVPRVLRDLLVERAEGNPYYLEELVKMLIDQRIIVKDTAESWRVEAGRLEYLPVPGTLNGLLQSSLDGLLYPEKLTLERAAVIGRIFYTQALDAIDTVDIDHIQNQGQVLQRLVNREDIHQRELTTFIDSEDYFFRSKMLRDMVLETIPEFRSKRYHRAAADWLVNAGEGRVEEFSDRIAHHYSSAGEDDRAADWYLRAAERAVSQEAYAEARKYFDEVLDLNRAKDLDKKWQALLGIDRVLGYVGDVQGRMVVDEELMAIAIETGNQSFLAEAHFRRGFTAFDAGQFRAAVNNFDAALDAAEKVNDLETAASSLSLKVFAHTKLGETEAARKTAVEALASAEELGDEYILAITLNNVSSFYSHTSDRVGAIMTLRRQAEICRRLRIQIGEGKALLNLGYEHLLLGFYDKGRDILERSLAITESIGARPTSAYSLLNLGLAHTRLGDAEQALEYLSEAASILVEFGDTFGQAACMLYRGYANEIVGDMQEAKKVFIGAAGKLSELEVPGMAIEAQAGTVRCLLSLGDLEEAERELTNVWDQLNEHGAQGIEFPILVYLTCSNGFTMLGDGDLSVKAIVDGKEMLDLWADKITVVEWRFAYLQNFPEHVAIQALYDEAAS